jgi:hypothetical protein
VQQRNPYSPPEAPIGDRTPELPQGERPKQIVWASWLLWTSVLLGLVSLYFTDELGGYMEELPEEARGMMRTTLIVTMAVSFTLYLWLIDRMRAGRNWARILLLAFMLLSFVSELAPGEYAEGAVYVGSRVIDGVLQVAAMVLMFAKPGSEWFRPRA